MKKRFTSLFVPLFIVTVLLLSAASVNAATIYVSTSGDDATGDGTSWATAYATIAKAIDAASANDEIWIAGGTYEIATGIIVDKNLSLYGGFSGTETAVDQRAKVGGGEEWEFTNSTEIKAAAGVKLITISAAVSLDGLTLNGDTKAGTQGVYVAGGSGTITRCIVKNNINNSADANLGDGAGISAKSGNKLTISFCWVDNNECTTGNKVGCGIRIYGNNSTVSNCLISNNKGVKNGGGIGVENQTGVVISNCRIIGNSTTANGGAIFYYKNAVIYNCLIEGNSANSGGGIYLRSYADDAQKIYNNIIVNNTAASSGGGIILHAGTGNHSSTTIYNNIVAGNMPNGINFGGTSNGTFVNNILYDNKTGSGGTVANVVSSKSPSFKNNILDSDNISNLTQTACIIETDPAKLFTDYASGNYAPPTTGFVGYNAGDASGLTFAGNSDYAGNARVQGTAIDIGAYELEDQTKTLTVNTNTQIATSSLTTGSVNIGDLLNGSFTLASGAHTPMVYADGVKLDLSESGGTYSYSLPQVTGNVVVNIGAFAEKEIPVSDDTWTNSSSSTTGYNSDRRLEVRNANGQYSNCRTYLRFNLPASIISGCNKAVLKLYINSSSDRANLQPSVRTVTSAVSDIADFSTLTWDVSGAAASAFDGEEVAVFDKIVNTSTSENTELSADLSEYIFAAMSGENVINIQIATNNDGYLHLKSLENGNADYVPVLVFESVAHEVTVTATNVTVTTPTLTDGKFTTTNFSENITFTVDNGYENPAVTVDGTAYVLGEPAADGTYTISLTGIDADKTVVITASQKPGTSVQNDEAGKVSVKFIDGRLSIDNAPAGSKMQVYDAMGHLLLEKNMSGSSSVFDCPLQAGVYLVKVGSLTQKILVK